MFLNPVKTSEENDLTFLENNEKEGLLETYARCLSCQSTWNICSQGGPNVCHKCGMPWWNLGRRMIVFGKRPLQDSAANKRRAYEQRCEV